MLARDVNPKDELNVGGAWRTVTTVIHTERADGTAGVWIYTQGALPQPYDADDPVPARHP